ncbi:hypothetical protein [Amycolatopsis lexingtonensis]|uniref:hypothetical protein n=1 Tax=Amycolatopsis lexingtonensis TaxID=218822 RepID=UPI003F720EDF
MSTTIESLARKLETEGGFSYDPRTRTSPTSGYAVSVNPEANRQLPGPVSTGVILGYAYLFGHLLDQPGKVLGAWRDSETGITHLDVSTVVGDREDALMLARAFGELAVWDYAGGEEIRTDAAFV